jgi:hypothetical protein
MDDDKILELTGKIEETLGKEDYAMISDTIGEILTGNSENMRALSERDNQIKSLKDRNEKLVAANGSLLQKLPMVRESDEDNSKEEKPAPKISLKDAFDSKGNFIH